MTTVLSFGHEESSTSNTDALLLPIYWIDHVLLFRLLCVTLIEATMKGRDPIILLNPTLRSPSRMANAFPDMVPTPPGNLIVRAIPALDYMY